MQDVELKRQVFVLLFVFRGKWLETHGTGQLQHECQSFKHYNFFSLKLIETVILYQREDIG